MKLDELEQFAIDFIDNGGDIPSNLTANQRFQFTAAMLKHVCSKVADNTEKITAHSKEKHPHHTLKDDLDAKVIGLFILAVAIIHSSIPPGVSIWDLLGKLLP